VNLLLFGLGVWLAVLIINPVIGAWPYGRCKSTKPDAAHDGHTTLPEWRCDMQSGHTGKHHAHGGPFW
jgi:hypothetical protein